MNDALFIGFTGTPIELEDKCSKFLRGQNTTLEIF